MGCTTSKFNHDPDDLYYDDSNDTIERSVSIHPQLVARRRVQIYDVYTLDSQELGSGVTGSVRCGTHKLTKQKYAIKIIRTKYMSEENKQLLKNEINILQQLDHPNIVKLYETYESPDELYLVMELCTGGELYTRLMEQHNCRFNEEEIRLIMRKLLSAVNYLHEKHIAHRDLKLSNILYKNKLSSELKLIDFGLSKVYMNDHHIKSMNTIVGTPYYIAPEVLQEHKEGYGKTCDIWSLGVIMYMLATGKPPITGADPNEILSNISTHEIVYSRADFKNYSKNMLVFLKRLLDKDPRSRYTAPEALNSPWLSCETSEVHIPYTYIQSIKSYAYKYSRLKRGILLVLAYNCEAPFIYNIRDIFLALDKDGRGRLSKQTFINALLENDMDLQPEDAEVIFGYIDEDDSEYVNYTEFVAACLPFEYINKEKYIQKVFHILDTENKNYISFYNLKEYFKSNTIEEVLTLLNEASIYTSKSPFPSMSEKRDVKEGQRADTSQYDEGLYDESYNEYLDLKIDYDQFKQIMMMNNDDQASTVTVTPRNNGNQSFSAMHRPDSGSNFLSDTKEKTMEGALASKEQITVPKRNSSVASIPLNSSNNHADDETKEKSAFYTREEPTRDLKYASSAIHIEQDNEGANSSLYRKSHQKTKDDKDIVVLKEGEIIPLDL